MSRETPPIPGESPEEKTETPENENVEAIFKRVLETEDVDELEGLKERLTELTNLIDSKIEELKTEKQDGIEGSALEDVEEQEESDEPTLEGFGIKKPSFEKLFGDSQELSDKHRDLAMEYFSKLQQAQTEKELDNIGSDLSVDGRVGWFRYKFNPAIEDLKMKLRSALREKEAVRLLDSEEGIPLEQAFPRVDLKNPEVVSFLTRYYNELRRAETAKEVNDLLDDASENSVELLQEAREKEKDTTTLELLSKAFYHGLWDIARSKENRIEISKIKRGE